MTKIFNTWKQPTANNVFYEVGEPVYQNRDYAAYKYSLGGYIYTYKNIAIGHRVGFSKNVIDEQANGIRPQGIQAGFAYDRMLENKRRGLEMFSNISE